MRHGRLGWAGAVAAWAAWAVAEEPPRGSVPPPLGVAAIELARLPPPSRALLVTETGRLLEPAGVRLAWRWTSPARESPAHELRIAFLDSRGRGAHTGGSVLAASGLTGPAASVWVYVPNVLTALGPGIGWLPESLRGQRELGTALGRVVAH